MTMGKSDHATADKTVGSETEVDGPLAMEPEQPPYGPLLRYMAKQPPSLIGIDACAGAQNLARDLHRLGHFVKIIYPPFPARKRFPG